MSTREDRGWMYDVEGTDRFLSYTFCSNLDVFLEFAFSNKAFVDNAVHIKCPCLECDNKHFKTKKDVMFHLYEKGFTPNYTTWSEHGERSSDVQHEGKHTGPVKDDERTCMEGDEVVPSNDVDNTTYESNYDSNILEGTKGVQKNLKVKVSSELFKVKRKNNIIKAALPQKQTIKILSLHKNLREYKDMGNVMSNAHSIILLRCQEVRPFIRLFDDFTRRQQPNIDGSGLEVYRHQHFAAWFKNYALKESNDVSQDLQDLAQGPIESRYTYKTYSINGYEFHTQRHSEGQLINRSGVCVRGSDDYGILDDVVEVKYKRKFHGKRNIVIVLFKCRRFDTHGGVGVKRKDNLVHIDSKVKLLNDSVFVLASLTEQVYYGSYPNMSKELRDWWALIKSQDEGIH